MNRRTPPQRRLEAPSRRHWIIAAVVGFLALDVLLVGMAFSLNRTGPHQEPGPIPTFSSSPNVAPSTAPSPSASPSPSPSATPKVAAVAPAPRFLAAVSATEAWRASPGTCPGTSAVIERSSDKGATWQKLDTGNDAVHQIVSLINANRTRASVIGPAGTDCKVGFFTSFTQGQDWAPYPDNLAGATYLDPQNPAKLHVGGQLESAPCAKALQLRYNDAAMAVMCQDTVFERTDTPTWTSVPVPGVLSIATSGSGYLLATSGAAGCAGVQIATLPSPVKADSTPRPVGCAASVTGPEAVTVSQSGTSVWLWTGNTTLVSTDGGITWP